MLRIYAKLSIRENNDIINFSKFYFTTMFITNLRKIEIGKTYFNTKGEGKEIFIDCLPNEIVNKTTVQFTIYLPSNRKYRTVYGHIYTDRKSSVTTTLDLKIFQDVSKQATGYKSEQRIIPQEYPIPDGLRMVAFLRNEIKKAAQKYPIGSQIIASIVFQEKYHGVWAYRKNLLSYYANFGVLHPNNSYGYPEMQLGLASELLGNKDNPNWIEETFIILCNDATLSMELIAKNILRGEKIFGKKFSIKEATIFYNGGEKTLRRYLANSITPEKMKKAVYYRSWRWQKAIEVALYGDIIAIPDDCNGSCKAEPESSIETWEFNPSLRGFL